VALRHAIANQALMAAGKLHPDKKIAKAARAALGKANSVGNSALTGPLLADASRGGTAER
jgi:hypothetical protein